MLLQYRRRSAGGSTPELSDSRSSGAARTSCESSTQFGDDDGPAGRGSGRGGAGGFGRDQHSDPVAAAAESTARVRSESGSAQSAVHLEQLDPSRGDPLLPAAGGAESRDPARPVTLTIVHTIFTIVLTPTSLCTAVNTE